MAEAEADGDAHERKDDVDDGQAPVAKGKPSAESAPEPAPVRDDLDVEVRKAAGDGPSRCPFCHSAVDADAGYECTGCRARFHLGCLAESKGRRCTACGSTVVMARRRTRTSPWERVTSLGQRKQISLGGLLVMMLLVWSLGRSGRPGGEAGGQLVRTAAYTQHSSLAYTVLMPIGVVDQEEQSFLVEGGSLVVHTAKRSASGEAFLVQAREFPEAAPEVTDHGAFVAGFAESMAEVGARLERRQPVEIDGQPGEELTFALEQGQREVTRMVWGGPRTVFLITVGFRPRPTSEARARRFLTSFRLPPVWSRR